MFQTAALLSLVLSAAQNPQGQPRTLNFPHPELEKLKVFVGNWEGTETFVFPAASTNPAKVQVRFRFDGRFLHCVHESEPGGNPMEGMHLIGWDPKAKNYQSWWFDSMTDGDARLHGDWKDGKLIFVSEPLNLEQMPDAIMRFTLSVEGDTWNYLAEMKSPKIPEFTKVFTGVYKKVARRPRG